MKMSFVIVGAIVLTVGTSLAVALFMRTEQIFYNDTITEEMGRKAYMFEMSKGEGLSGEINCKDDDDQIRAIVITEGWFGRSQAEESVPSSEILAEIHCGFGCAGCGHIEWICPEDGTYYLILKPIGGEWPVPYGFWLEERKSDLWFVGALVAVVGSSLLCVGFAKKPPIPTPVTYASGNAGLSLRHRSLRLLLLNHRTGHIVSRNSL